MSPQTLTLTIDPAAAAAPFEQVRTQIADQARDGGLPVGYKLPTVRGLAEELGLAANTVAKAYRALETDGVIETRGRNGSFIAAAGEAAPRKPPRRRDLRPPRPAPRPGPPCRPRRRRERPARHLRNRHLTAPAAVGA